MARRIRVSVAGPCCDAVVCDASSAAGRSGRAGCREERSTSLTPTGFSHGQAIRIALTSTRIRHTNTSAFWITIGATNFDNRSFAHNEETSVCVRDGRLAQLMEKTFLDDMRACYRVELEAWRNRGLLAKSLEAVASLLEAQV